MNKRAFTLIELLVAITIIAILIGLGTYTWINAQEKGRDGKRKSEMKEVQKALEIYSNMTGRYPPADGSGRIMCQGSGANENPNPNKYDVSTISWGARFECVVPADNITDVFMDKLPQDPKTANPQYYYEYSSSNDSRTYKISVALENTQDKDLTNLPCTVQQSASYNYCVTNP